MKVLLENERPFYSTEPFFLPTFIMKIFYPDSAKCLDSYPDSIYLDPNYHYKSQDVALPEHGVHRLLGEQRLLRDLVSSGVGKVTAVGGRPTHTEHLNIAANFFFSLTVFKR
jgi:hypothetical protein